MSRILVTGAAGCVGSRLVKALCEQDWVEKVVGIDVREPADNHAKYVFVRHDVREPVETIVRTHGIGAVAHLAFVVSPIHDRRLTQEVNVQGAENILAASARSTVTHILYTSSAMVYGFNRSNTIPLTEDSPLNGDDDFAYVNDKRKVEAIMREFADRHPQVAVTVLRPCFVVGPGCTNPLLNHLKRKIVFLPTHSAPLQFVHEDDLASIMSYFMKMRKRGIYNVAGEGAISFAGMVKTLGNKSVSVGWPAIYCLNHLAWLLRLRCVTEVPSPALKMMVAPWIVSSSKLISQTGYKFRYDSIGAFEDFARSVWKGKTRDRRRCSNS